MLERRRHVLVADRPSSNVAALEHLVSERQEEIRKLERDIVHSERHRIAQVRRPIPAIVRGSDVHAAEAMPLPEPVTAEQLKFIVDSEVQKRLMTLLSAGNIAERADAVVVPEDGPGSTSSAAYEASRKMKSAIQQVSRSHEARNASPVDHAVYANKQRQGLNILDCVKTVERTNIQSKVKSSECHNQPTTEDASSSSSSDSDTDRSRESSHRRMAHLRDKPERDASPRGKSTPDTIVVKEMSARQLAR